MTGICSRSSLCPSLPSSAPSAEFLWFLQLMVPCGGPSYIPSLKTMRNQTMVGFTCFSKSCAKAWAPSAPECRHLLSSHVCVCVCVAGEKPHKILCLRKHSCASCWETQDPIRTETQTPYLHLLHKPTNCPSPPSGAEKRGKELSSPFKNSRTAWLKCFVWRAWQVS